MKTSIFKLFALMCIVGLLFVIPSCNDDDEDDDTLDTDTQSAIDNSYAEDAVSQAFSTVNQYGLNEASIKSTTQGCVTITVVPLVGWPRIMTIDFGTECPDHNGVIRKGIINAEFSGPWYNVNPGTTVTITFDNYFVNGIKREGTFTVTVNDTVIVTVNDTVSCGVPSNTSIEAAGAKLIFPNGDEVSWNSTRTTEWIAGFNTICDSTSCIEDDVFLFGGNSSGVNRNGLAYTVEITTPLRVEMSCKWITKGVFNLTPAGHATRTVDFGDGTCDNDATVTISGITIGIKL